jgi:DNA-binding CsgD family transcriptional regulator
MPSSNAANWGTNLAASDNSCSPSRESWQSLTARQREVAELSARRRSAKQIADQLGISEGRVNQHIAAIKVRLHVNDLAGVYDAVAQADAPYRESLGQKLQVPEPVAGSHEAAGVSPEAMSLSDAMSLRHFAPWESDAYRVGPGAFDGPGGSWLRVASVIAISLGTPLLLVLLITARWAVTAAFSPAP